MIMRKFTKIMLALVLLSTMFSMNVGATDNETTPIDPADAVDIAAVEIKGSVGNKLSVEITLVTNNNGFASISANSSVLSWFTNLPDAIDNDWSARVKSDVPANKQALIIVLTGTPATPSSLQIEMTVPAARISAGTKNSTGERKDITVLPSSDAKFNIVPTVPVKLVVEKNDDKINGTLTATAMVNGQSISKTTDSDGVATIYVQESNLITFTAKPNTRYTVKKWTGVNLKETTGEPKTASTFTRKYGTLKGENPVNYDELAADIVTVSFTEIPTAYRILEVQLGNVAKDNATKNYTVTQKADADDKDVTKVYQKVGDVSTQVEDDLVVMKFGETAPIIIKKDKVIVKTDKKNGNGDDGDEDYVAPIDEKSGYNAEYNLTITSKTIAAVKVEVVPATSTAAYRTLKTELTKYIDSSYITPAFTIDDINGLKEGDLIITPQGAGTSVITITAKRQNDTNTPKLNDGKIEFNIKVEMPKTDKYFDTKDGILTATATSLYGEKQTLTLNINNETATINKNETVISIVSIAGYSVNGTSWSSLSISTDTDIAKIFDKSAKSLKFASALSSSKSAPGATIWDIGEIGSRQKAPKLKVYYGNPNGKNEIEIDGDTWGDTWTVTGFDYKTANTSEKESDAKLFFASSADKKTADTDDLSNNNPTVNADAKFGFTLFGKNDKFPLVKDLSNNKVIKTTYLFRLSATWEKQTIDSEDGVEEEVYVITPASKTVKLTVSSKLKPGNAKVDYKKERVTLKAGSAYYYGDDIKGTTIADAMTIAKTKAAIMTKSTTKSGILFRGTNENTIGGNLLDNTPSSISNIIYWTAANGKKPRSVATIITVHNYQSWSTTDTDRIEKAFIKGSGKYKLPKGYEVLLPNEEKWKTSVSVKKFSSGENTVKIRKKGNAKFDAKNTSTWLKAGTNTASESKTFAFIFGEYTVKGKTKTGITGVNLYINTQPTEIQ